MQRNIAGKWVVFAWTIADNLPKTGNAAQITANIYLDGVANPVDDVNPTELGAGYYVFDVTAAESNGDNLVIVPVSSSPGVMVIGVPGSIWTIPQNAVPAGAYKVSMQFYVTSTVTPISDVLFDIYNDTETIKMNGSAIVANSLGQASFLINNGSYKIRPAKAGVTFTTASLTVSGADTSKTVYGDAVSYPTPAAGMQTIIGNVRKLDWSIPTGETVTAEIAENRQIVGGAAILTDKITSPIDISGNFSLTVPCGSRIKIVVPDHGDHTISVTDVSGVVNISTYIV